MNNSILKTKKYKSLHAASEDGDLDSVVTLVNKGIEIDAKTKRGWTPLFLAAIGRHQNVVKYLIDAGADVNYVRNCNTVLHIASKEGWLEIVKSLVEKGADISAKDRCESTAVVLAALYKRKKVVAYLINAGADINSGTLCNRTLLHIAAKYGWSAIAKNLVDKGADIEAKIIGVRGDTPMIVAAKHKRRDVVKYLLLAGADTKCGSYRSRKMTLVHYAALNGWDEIIKYLEERGANIFAKDPSGHTPLQLAAIKRHKGVVKYLVGKGADVNSICGEHTLLQIASQEGWIAILDSLVQKGADIEATGNISNTPLQMAVHIGKLGVVRHLVNAGADVNVGSIDGQSLMYSLVQKRASISLLILLIKSGAYLMLNDYSGMKQIQLIRERMFNNIELCSCAIINEFNHKVLPELYKKPFARDILPFGMEIGKRSQVAQQVLEMVKHAIEARGHCDLFKKPPLVLKVLAAKSCIIHWDSIRAQHHAANKNIRLAKCHSYNTRANSYKKLKKE